MEIKKYRLILPKPTVTGGECKNPQVEVLGSSNILIECIDKAKGEYEIQGVEGEADRCITFIIKCEDCSDCSPVEVTKCLCEFQSDCGPCEDCIGSVCTTLCPDDEFCDSGTCVECNNDFPCPGGQICKNGQCVCPQDKPFFLNGRCVQCLGDTIENCSQCIDNILVPINCVGVCDPTTNDCVECLISSDCDGINECCIGKECKCCPGFQRNADGNCEPIPECSVDGDCGDCEVCRFGICEPTPCPAGQTCVSGFGCVPECDCLGNVPCPGNGNCVPAVQNSCGCIPCTGNCTDGCGDGCYCNGSQCVGNPCVNGNCPCNDGTDCPEGFGCQNGQCVPCATLECSTNECGNVLGCACAGNICVDADNQCQNTPCSVSSDCGFGCTCYQGQCVSCSNFPCVDCNRPGCNCNGLFCEGEDLECTDTFTLTKNNTNCSLTASLTKEECCSCDEVTLNIRGRRTGETNTSYTLQFVSEVRKGSVENISNVTNLPLLDNISNPLINENDSPTSGTVVLTYTVRYQDYEILENGTSVSLGFRESDPIQQQVSFTTGTTSSQTFTNVTLPKISTETIDGNIRSVVRSVTIIFTNTNNFSFPNECTYNQLPSIGTYVITNNNGFLSFGTQYSNPVGNKVTSDDCRLPVFRWFKSDDGNFTSPAFRKRYVDGNNTFTETLSLLSEGLESCKHFMVETDCSCAENPSDYIVFCNPSLLDYQVTNCARNFELLSFDTCDVNSQKQFRVEAGSINITFTEANAPINQVLTSNVAIENVVFSLVCDSEGQCTKTYPVENPLGSLEVDLDIICNPSQQGVFTVPIFDSQNVCNVNSLTIDGTTYFPNQTVTLSPGNYPATITWSCGCPPTIQTIEVSCCTTLIPQITRDCDGTVNCSQLSGTSYVVDGQIQSDICNYVSLVPLTDSVEITVERINCPDIIINIPAIQNSCCDDFQVLVNRISASVAEVQVLNEGNPTFTLSDGNPDSTFSETIVQTGIGLYEARNLFAGSTYTLTVESSISCNDITVTIPSETDLNDCNTNVGLSIINSPTSDSCTMVASVTGPKCPCLSGQWRTEILGISNVTATTMDVQYQTRHVNFPDRDTESVDASIREVSNGNIYPISNVTNINTGNTITVNRVFSLGGQECVGGSISYSYDEVNSPLVDVSFNLTGDILGLRVSDSATLTLRSLTTNQTVNGSAGTPSQFVFVSHPPNQSSTFELKAEIPGENDYVFIFTIDLSNKSDLGNLTVNACRTVQEEINAGLQFRLINLTLEDGCQYGGVTTTYEVKSDGFISNPVTRSLGLSPFVLNDGKTRFEWTRDNVNVYQDYSYNSSVLPDNLAVQGSTYEVEAICDVCEDLETLDLCCPINVTTSLAACNDSVTITVDANPGDYIVNFNGNTSNITIPPEGTPQQVTYTDQLPPNSTVAGNVVVSGIANCLETFAVVTNPPCPNSLGVLLPTDMNTTQAVSGINYTLTFANPVGNLPASVTFDNSGNTYPANVAVISGNNHSGSTIVTPAEIIDAEFGQFGFDALVVEPRQSPTDPAGVYVSPTMCIRGPKDYGDWTLSYIIPINGGASNSLWQIQYNSIGDTFTIVAPVDLDIQTFYDNANVLINLSDVVADETRVSCNG